MIFSMAGVGCVTSMSPWITENAGDKSVFEYIRVDFLFKYFIFLKLATNPKVSFFCFFFSVNCKTYPKWLLLRQYSSKAAIFY